MAFPLTASVERALGHCGEPLCCLAPGTLLNTTVTGAQEMPAVALGPDGGSVIVFRDRSGTALDDADFVVPLGTSGDRHQPAVAATPDGGFPIAWRDTGRRAPDTSSGTIRARRLGADGQLAATEVPVDSTTAGEQSEPALAVAPDGRWAVAFTVGGLGDGDASGTGVRLRFFGTDDWPRSHLRRTGRCRSSSRIGRPRVRRRGTTCSGGSSTRPCPAEAPDAVRLVVPAGTMLLHNATSNTLWRCDPAIACAVPVSVGIATQPAALGAGTRIESPSPFGDSLWLGTRATPSRVADQAGVATSLGSLSPDGRAYQRSDARKARARPIPPDYRCARTRTSRHACPSARAMDGPAGRPRRAACAGRVRRSRWRRGRREAAPA